jgi:cystathionine beta-lyase
LSFDFDQIIQRAGTACQKYDARKEIFGNAEVIPLWVADMDFAAPPAVTRALAERATHPVYGYAMFPESLFDALIAWLKRRFAWTIQREWIVMCPGVVPTLHAACLAYVQPGEAVIIQPPVYFPFFSAINNTGRQVLQNPLRFENGRYEIDFDHLEQCASNARLLMLCSPHNPVSRVWRKDELERLLGIAKKHDLLIFSDEIHADLVYPDFQHFPLAKLAGNSANVITAVAPSKTFNIPGLNLSALIVPDPEQRKAITSAFDQLHVSAANPFSITAFEAAYHEGEPWLNALLVYLQETREYVSDYLKEHLPEIHLITPEGTYLLWLDCRDLGMSDAQLKHFFVEKAGVGLSHGTLFGKEGSGFMRMNIGAPRGVIRLALDGIVQALKYKNGEC